MGPGIAIEAILKIGVPLLLLSWFLFHRIFSEGLIGRKDGRRAIKAGLKRNKKAFADHGNHGARLIYRRWGWFGGGFYGLAALWTFVAIELADLIGFLSSGNLLAPLGTGVMNLVVAFLANQLANSIEALLWFGYWPSGNESVLLWVIVAYLGYWGGVELARRQLTPQELPALLSRHRTPETGEVSDHEKK